MRSPIFFVIVFSFFLCCDGRAAAEKKRIAVLGAEEVNNEATLLNAALSHREGVETLERGEMVRLLEEHGLAIGGMTDSRSLQIGELLHADLLVILERNSRALSVRTIGVRHGVVVGYSTAQFPLEELGVWAEMRAAEIAALAAKTRLPSAAISALSLLRVNSILASADGHFLEELANVLLSARLAGEPSVILLERESLQEASFEKNLGLLDTPFWSSAWIVSGSVANVMGNYSLDLRLESSTGESHRLHVESDQISTLIEKGAVELLTKLGRSSAGWKSSDESVRFLQEAKWAASNRMWNQSIRAAEASIALGNNSAEALRWRWQCYQHMASEGAGTPSRPSPEQYQFMARSLALYADPAPVDHGKTISFPRVFPESKDGSRGEGTLLLKIAAELIARTDWAKDDSAQDRAIEELRLSMHALFEKMAATSPDLTLLPSKEKGIPRWSNTISKEKTASNIHAERLFNGKLWEQDPEAYYRYIEKCLVSDLQCDAYFYQNILSVVASVAELDVFMRPKTGDAWRRFGEHLAKSENPRKRMAAAFILCRTGLPVLAVEVLANCREDILAGRVSPEYLTAAFSTGPVEESLVNKDPNSSVSRAAGKFRDLIVELLNRDYDFSAESLHPFGTYLYSQLQAASLVDAFAAYAERNASGTWPREKVVALEGLLRELRARAGQKVRAATVPPHDPLSEDVAMSTAPSNLQVDRAWLATSLDRSSERGSIKYAAPVGGIMWLEIEYSAAKSDSVRREIVSVDLSTMSEKIIRRDTIPKERTDTSGRGGPTFAVDGEGVFFWDGKSIAFLEGKKIKTWATPELSRPLFWMVNQKLYVADRKGTIMRFDRREERFEIMGSTRRRPIQSVLDEEAGLAEIYRVYGSGEGKVSLSLGNGKTYVFNESDAKWQVLPEPRREGQLSDQLTDGWNVSGRVTGQSAGLFLSEYNRKADQRNLRDRIGWPRCGTIKDDLFWALVPAREKMSLLCLHLESGVSRSRILDFSAEFHPAISAGQRADGSISIGEARILSFREGIAIYSVNEPVLWFLPSSDLSPLHENAKNQ